MNNYLIVGIVFVLCALFTVYLIWTAPEGWEDEQGFHLGTPPKDHTDD